MEQAGQQTTVVGSACRAVPTVTMDQIKAARILLGWSESVLAKRSRRTTGTVKRAEAGRLHIDLIPSVARSLRRALEDAGVEFLDHGQPSAERGGTRCRSRDFGMFP